MSKANKATKKDMEVDSFIEGEVSEDKNRFVLVRNKLPYHFGVALYVTNPYTKQLQCKNMILYPGMNEVKLSIWEEALKNNLIKARLEGDDLEYNGPKGFIDLPANKQEKIAKNIFDKRLLINLKNSTNDASVLKALNEQIDKIDKAGKGRIN